MQSFGTLRESVRDVPPAWLLCQPPLSTKSRGGAGVDFKLPRRLQAYDAHVEAICEAKPTFERGANGTYIMELSGVDVQVTTTCNPEPSCIGSSGRTFFRPHGDFFLALPEVRSVVFDPVAQTPAGLSVAATAQKRMTVLEVSDAHDLSANIRTNSPSGSITLEDVRWTGSYRDVVAEMTLNYELRANGKISISQHGGVHEVTVEFDLEFQCWLTGSMTTFSPLSLSKSKAPLSDRTQHSASELPRHPVHDRTTHESAERTGPLSVPEDDMASKEKSPCAKPERPSANACTSSTGHRHHHPGQTAAAALYSGDHGLDSNGDIFFEKPAYTPAHDSSNDAKISGCPENAAPPAAQALDAKAKRKNYASSSLRLSFSSTQALRALECTHEQLSRIEIRLENISSMLDGASDSDLCLLKAEVSQIEAKAKQLEVKGTDDIYTGGLHSGRKMAKDAKKDLLARFEALFGSVDKVFATIQAKLL